MAIVGGGSLGNPPDIFLAVEIGRVWWKKAEFDFVGVLQHPSFDFFGVVIPGVIENQEDLAAPSKGHHPLDEFQKGGRVEALRKLVVKLGVRLKAYCSKSFYRAPTRLTFHDRSLTHPRPRAGLRS